MPGFVPYPLDRQRSRNPERLLRAKSVELKRPVRRRRANEEVRATRTGHGVHLRRKLAGCDIGQHRIALLLSVAELGPANHDGLMGLVSQVQRLHNGAAAKLALGHKVVKGVFQPVVLVAPLVARTNPADDDSAIGHFRQFIRLHEHPPVGKVDGKGLRVTEPMPSTRLEQRRDQPGREPAVIGCEGMIRRPARLPDCLEGGFRLVQSM